MIYFYGIDNHPRAKLLVGLVLAMKFMSEGVGWGACWYLEIK